MSAAPEFYVGWLPRAPRALARRTRRTAALLVVGAALLGLALPLAHRRLGAATFEYGTVRTFRGTVAGGPAPRLLVGRPGTDTRSAWLLVAPGKHGAAELAAPWDGRWVELEGSLAHRGDDTLVELVPGSLRPAPPDAPSPAPRESLEVLGPRAFRGEIVDSKCFLGVMNPGRGKTHRACAARCISGGVPPLLRTADADGRPLDLLLVGPAGEALNRAVLPFVAEPVSVAGTLVRAGERLFLRADPAAIQRLGGDE